jgi:hypothetical protein
MHYNEPSRGAQIDKKLMQDDEQRIKEKQELRRAS